MSDATALKSKIEEIVGQTARIGTQCDKIVRYNLEEGDSPAALCGELCFALTMARTLVATCRAAVLIAGDIALRLTRQTSESVTSSLDCAKDAFRKFGGYQ